jgi:lipopolysaccharide transport system ATP-binding protein
MSYNSMQSDLALSVRGLSKRFTIRSRQTAAGVFAKRSVESDFWALRDVSFSIARGEVLGVIGRNGAGKSTLLKILTRISAPTHGEADLYGRVGSLLEVGTGFHPELTGRENIYLNGSILGMRRREITAQFDAIVQFAGVEQFLETPVKRYSSGMYVRLAFAVAAHLKSEILLVDEVLAVGDVEFQRRCLGKMQDVARSGRTVVFVSHHLESLSGLCNRLLVLDQGRLVFDGDVAGGVERYMASFFSDGSRSLATEKRAGSGEFRVVSATPSKEFYECGEPKSVSIRLERKDSFTGNFFVSVHLVDAAGMVLLHCDSRLVGTWFKDALETEVNFTLEAPWLRPGRYRLDVFVCSTGVIDHCEGACFWDVLPLLPYGSAVSEDATAHGLVFGEYGFEQTA